MHRTNSCHAQIERDSVRTNAPNSGVRTEPNELVLDNQIRKRSGIRKSGFRLWGGERISPPREGRSLPSGGDARTAGETCGHTGAGSGDPRTAESGGRRAHSREGKSVPDIPVPSLNQPTSAPAVRPLTICRCSRMKNSIIGIMTTTNPAAIAVWLVLRTPCSICTPTGSVLAASELVRK